MATTTHYKKYRLKESLKFARFCVTLIALALLVVFAPDQAHQITGYIGMFLLGGSKLKNVIGI